MNRTAKIKFDLYEESGVREYWIVFRELKTVAVYVLKDGQYRPTGEYYTPGPIPVLTLPGFALEWNEVLEGA